MSETGRGGRRMFRARTLSPSAFRRKMRKRHVQSESDESDAGSGSDQHDEAAAGAAAAAGGTEVHTNSTVVYQADEYEPVSADKYDALVLEYEKQRDAMQKLEDEVAAQRTQLTQADEREREFADFVREVEEREEKHKRRERHAEKAQRERREDSETSQIRELQARIEELEDNAASSRTTIAKLKEMHKDADDEVKRLQEVKTLQHRKIQQMEDQLTPASESTDHIRRLGADAQKQEKRSEIVEEKNRQLAERCANLASQIDKMETELDQREKQCRELQREVEESGREKKKLQRKLEDMRKASAAVPGSPVPGPAKAVHSLLDDLKGTAKRNRRTPVTSPNQRPRGTPPLSQRVVGGKAVQPYDEAKERILAEELKLKPMFRIFFLTCLSVKSKMTYAFPDLDVMSVDSRKLWRDASEKNVAFELYPEWVERELLQRASAAAQAASGGGGAAVGGNSQQGLLSDMSATPNTIKRRYEERPRPPMTANSSRVSRR